MSSGTLSRLNVDISSWLTIIQGKLVSPAVMNIIKEEVGDVSGRPNREIFNSVKSIIERNGYTDIDPNYVYQNIIGLHIHPMNLQQESFVYNKFQEIYETIGESMNRIPYIYILWKIVHKYNLDIDVRNNFSIDKTKIFDGMLGNLL
jgi:hypothetical protein